MSDHDSLQRFVDAQAPIFEQACRELEVGRKTSHWMWFVFPQCRGLGRSSTALHYGIESADEALAYWRHPLLGPRLKHCSELVLNVRGRTALQIMGTPDDMKLHSSMTLFSQVAPAERVFTAVLDKYYEGLRDQRTLALLQPSS
jgi:uncharacterized protein (DUF1810 family)